LQDQIPEFNTITQLLSPTTEEERQMAALITTTTGMMVQEKEVMLLAQEDQMPHVIHKDMEPYAFQYKSVNCCSTRLEQWLVV
jgi:hypothetical protein